jgi:hypothetical protein
MVLDFFVGGRSCGRLMSPAREIRLLRWRLPCKGGGLTGMLANEVAKRYSNATVRNILVNTLESTSINGF